MCYTVDFRIYNLQPFSEADNQFHRYCDLSENEHTCFKQSVQCAGRANKIKNDVNLIYHTEPNDRKKTRKKQNSILLLALFKLADCIYLDIKII